MNARLAQGAATIREARRLEREEYIGPMRSFWAGIFDRDAEGSVLRMAAIGDVQMVEVAIASYNEQVAQLKVVRPHDSIKKIDDIREFKRHLNDLLRTDIVRKQQALKYFKGLGIEHT